MIVVEVSAMDLTSVIVDSFKDFFDAMGMQVLSLPLIIAATYILSFLVLRLIKIPKSISKSLSSLVTLIVFYFTFTNIFS